MSPLSRLIVSLAGSFLLSSSCFAKLIYSGDTMLRDTATGIEYLNPSLTDRLGPYDPSNPYVVQGWRLVSDVTDEFFPYAMARRYFESTFDGPQPYNSEFAKWGTFFFGSNFVNGGVPGRVSECKTENQPDHGEFGCNINEALYYGSEDSWKLFTEGSGRSYSNDYPSDASFWENRQRPAYARVVSVPEPAYMGFLAPLLASLVLVGRSRNRG